MVEVPGPERIVEIEKIVEVPVETIIERTVEVPVVDNEALEKFRAENQGLKFKIDNLTKKADLVTDLEQRLLEAVSAPPVIEYQEKIVEVPIEVERPADLRRAAELLSNSELNIENLSVDQIHDILQKSSEADVRRRLGFWAVSLPKKDADSINNKLAGKDNDHG